MYEWYRMIQMMIDRIDESIRSQDGDELLLNNLASYLGYSPFYTTTKFRELTGHAFRDYLRLRRLAFALIDLRDTDRRILDIAITYGFSSHEAFTRAFKKAYGITPLAYRKHPVPLVLRTIIHTYDRNLLGTGDEGMAKVEKDMKVYFARIPAHKFLFIKNYESDGYWDFWRLQDEIPGQDCDTICGLLDSIKGKLDGQDQIIGQYSGQIMARLYEGKGKTPEAYGVRLPANHAGPFPDQMVCADVPEAEYIVFEYDGAFDFNAEYGPMIARLDEAEKAFDYAPTDYEPDHSMGRIAYFMHDEQRYNKRVLPVRKKS